MRLSYGIFTMIYFFPSMISMVLLPFSVINFPQFIKLYPNYAWGNEWVYLFYTSVICYHFIRLSANLQFAYKIYSGKLQTPTMINVHAKMHGIVSPLYTHMFLEILQFFHWMYFICVGVYYQMFFYFLMMSHMYISIAQYVYYFSCEEDDFLYPEIIQPPCGIFAIMSLACLIFWNVKVTNIISDSVIDLIDQIYYSTVIIMMCWISLFIKRIFKYLPYMRNIIVYV